MISSHSQPGSGNRTRTTVCLVPLLLKRGYAYLRFLQIQCFSPLDGVMTRVPWNKEALLCCRPASSLSCVSVLRAEHAHESWKDTWAVDNSVACFSRRQRQTARGSLEHLLRLIQSQPFQTVRELHSLLFCCAEIKCYALVSVHLLKSYLNNVKELMVKLYYNISWKKIR